MLEECNTYRLEYCLLVKTTEDFNKDYTLSFDTDEMRDDWITSIAAAKENKPVPDSINLSKMTKEQFDSKIQKSYNEILEGKSRPAKQFFDELLGR